MKDFIFGKPLAAAHRGHCGGNIPCNTLISYERAVRDGAEVIELDVSKSRDGELFCFHPGMEPVFFAEPTPILEMQAEDVKKRHILNTDRNETQFVPPLFDEALELLNGRCLIAVDKFWMYMPEITAAIRRHHMEDSVICKLDGGEKSYREALIVAENIPLLPIVRHKDEVTEKYLESGLRLFGLEVIFDDEQDPVASDDYIASAHGKGLALWVNSIIYDHRKQLSGGHSDDAAVSGDPDTGWGWLIDKKYDIIQTDWIPEFLSFRNSRLH